MTHGNNDLGEARRYLSMQCDTLPYDTPVGLSCQNEINTVHHPLEYMEVGLFYKMDVSGFLGAVGFDSDAYNFFSY